MASFIVPPIDRNRADPMVGPGLVLDADALPVD
jgi:hypothetical protein